MFPGVYINLNLGQEKGEGGTWGRWSITSASSSTTCRSRSPKWKAAGVPVLPGTNNRPDQAFVVTPDGVRIEILEDKTQTVPIKNEHVHFFVPESRYPEGAGLVRQDLRRRSPAPATMPRWWMAFPASRFASPRPIPRRRRPATACLDHIGFDLKDHEAFVKKIRRKASSSTSRSASRRPAASITYITDPWGTRIEIIQRAPLGPLVQ